jgi:hypothetical protein
MNEDTYSMPGYMEQPKKEVKKELTYTDPQSGSKLHGFSQIDLDALNKKLEKNSTLLKHNTIAVWAIGAGLIGFLIFFIWLVSYVISHNVLNNIVGACLR